jgi:membrane protein YqaA with SNARE-associated domain
VRNLFFSFLGYFLTPVGLIALGVLDSSLIFFLPLGIDFVLILLTAKKPEWFWMYAVLATVGSVVGSAFTFWIGSKIGEVGLERFVKGSRLKRVQERVGRSAAVTVGALGIIPPPFPFTAFVLTSGAAKVNAWTFLFTLAGVRALRFGVEGALAAHYGRGIIAWMKSPTFTIAVSVVTGMAVIGTVISAVALYRSARKRSRGARDQMVNRRSAATPP